MHIAADAVPCTPVHADIAQNPSHLNSQKATLPNHLFYLTSTPYNKAFAQTNPVFRRTKPYELHVTNLDETSNPPASVRSKLTADEFLGERHVAGRGIS